MARIPRKAFVINLTIAIIAAVVMWLIFRDHTPREGRTVEMPRNGLTIVTEFSPNNFVIRDDGTFGGLQPELADLLLPDIEIHWLPVETRKEAITRILNGEADIYASSIPLSSEGAYPGTESTEPLYTTAFALIYPDGTDWMADFAGSDHTVVIYGSADDPSAERIIKNISDLSYPSLTFRALPESSMEVALRVVKKELPYALIEKNLAERITDKLGDSVAISTDLAFRTSQVWLLKEGRDSLLHRLNQRILEVKPTKQYKEIIEKYLHERK